MSRSGLSADPISRRGVCPADTQGCGLAGSHRAATTAVKGGAWGLVLLLLVAPLQSFAAASVAADPQQLFNDNCDSCHQGTVPRAPHLVTFQLFGSEAIYAAMTEGTMGEQAEHLGPAE